MPSSPQPDAETSHTERFLIFQLGGEHYGIPIAAVSEVVRHPASLTPVPGAPPFVKGLMNLRGGVIPVIDQRQRFAVPGEALAHAGRVIVLGFEQLKAGFAVDAVSEIREVKPSELSATPELGEGPNRVFDRIVKLPQQDRMILLIDPKALLDSAEHDLLAALAARSKLAPP